MRKLLVVLACTLAAAACTHATEPSVDGASIHRQDTEQAADTASLRGSGMTLGGGN